MNYYSENCLPLHDDVLDLLVHYRHCIQMALLQKGGCIIGRGYQFQPSTLVRVSSAHLYQVKRPQTTQPVESDEHQLEWNNARPLSEVPTFSTLSMLWQFRPGGKYHKLGFGNMLKIFYKEYGDIFYLPGLFGVKPLLITYNPDDFHKIFRTEGIYPYRRPFALIAHHRNELRKDFFQGVEGLVHTQGEQWGTFRTAVNPVLMQPRTIKSYIPNLSTVSWEFIERILEIRDPVTLEVPDNFEEELNRYTLDSVSVVALDKQIGVMRLNRENLEVKTMFLQLTVLFRLLYELEIEPSIWKIIRTPKYHEMMACLDGINSFVIKYIDEAIERLDKFPSNKPESEKGVLEKLLKIDKKVAIVMALDMLLAGVDTTTTTLTGILICLAKNPEKQEKLREELRKQLPQKDSVFNEEIISKMPYLRAVIKESIRFYPLGETNIRTTGKDLVLSGYRIPKGTDVSMACILAKHDPRYYVQPLKFLPERWLRRDGNSDSNDEVIGSTCKNPFVYLPFGFGPRMCVGRRVVDLEMEISVARIVRNFNIEFNYPTENVFRTFLINTPNMPLRFKFTDIQEIDKGK